jgi:glycine dehydrogenase subunit 2
MWSKEDIDTWIAVLSQVCHEAYTTPEIVRGAPHNHPAGRVDAAPLEDPSRWAMTWRSHLKKRVNA